MTEPKRYEMQRTIGDGYTPDCEMTESPDGKYVLYTDFQESERKREAAEKLLEKFVAKFGIHSGECYACEIRTLNGMWRHSTDCLIPEADQLLASLKGE